MGKRNRSLREGFAVDNSGVADLQTSDEGLVLVEEKRPEALGLIRRKSITLSCCKCGTSVRDVEKARGGIAGLAHRPTLATVKRVSRRRAASHQSHEELST
jgi:hypothetical protein